MPSTSFYLIAVGGAAGAVARHVLQTAVQGRWPQPWPVGILAVNLLGCLAAGLVLGLLERHTLAAGWRLLLLTGVCGGHHVFGLYLGWGGVGARRASVGGGALRGRQRDGRGAAGRAGLRAGAVISNEELVGLT